MRRAILAVLGVAVLAPACSRPPTGFSVDNALAHVRTLAGTIGSRPIGSDANRRAREYLVERLRHDGFAVRVQEADAERRGTTAHVFNIIATRAGRRAQAIALVSHYDSVPDGPGAADDGLGVAVCVEAGRVLATRPQPNYALAVVLTDGEEVGLMGAAAVVKDPIAGWIRAVLNFEAVGTDGPNLLFETSAGSRPMLDAWARTAPPAGASFMTEIYRRLPNDTDFSVLRRARFDGVNFAAVGNSYAYHTTRDSGAHLDPAVVRQAGENALAIATALDERDDLPGRAVPASVYFDVLGRWAVIYTTRTALVLLAAAVLAALFAWLTVRPAVRTTTLFMTALWAVGGVAVVFGAMVGAAWLLRATRETCQPWYAHADRFFTYLTLAGLLAGWIFVRAGRLLAPGLRGSARPAAVWTIVIPLWTALAVAAQVFAPSAAYLAVLPLLAAGVVLTVVPVRREPAIRIASAIVLAVAGVFWIGNGVLPLHFAVAVFGRLPIITPIYVYPALLLSLGLFVVPPLFGLAIGLGRPQLVGSVAEGRISDFGRQVGTGVVLVALFVLAAAWCWFAPAYNDDRPLHGAISYVRDASTGQARWQIASNEPGIEVAINAPMTGTWKPGAPRVRPELAVPAGLGPFAFYASTEVSDRAPAAATGSLKRDERGAAIEVTVVPNEPAVSAQIALPEGVMPEETNLTGSQQPGAPFVARYIALPPAGVTLRARVSRADAAQLAAGLTGQRATVIAMRNGLPGAAWPTLPGWLPKNQIAWRARSYYTMPVALVTNGK